MGPGFGSTAARGKNSKSKSCSSDDWGVPPWGLLACCLLETFLATFFATASCGARTEGCFHVVLYGGARTKIACCVQ